MKISERIEVRANRPRHDFRLPCLWFGWVFFVLGGFASSAHCEPSLPFRMPSMVEVRTIRSALLKTSKGNLVFELYPEVAPYHVANFKFLSEQGFFKDKKIDRVLPNHVIMFGEPTPTEVRKYSYSVPPEFSERKHLVGTLSMARDPRAQQSITRHSSATRVHLLLSENARMDGDFTAFGQMISGESVLRSLREGDSILDLQVFISAGR